MQVNINGLKFKWSLTSFSQNFFDTDTSPDSWVDLLMELNVEGLTHSQKLHMQAKELLDLVATLRDSGSKLQAFSFANLEENFKIEGKFSDTGVLLIAIEVNCAFFQDTMLTYRILLHGKTDPYSLENCLIF